MKLSVTIALTLASTTLAQGTNGLPGCAQTCVNKYTSGSGIGGCQSLDVKCICSASSFLANIACCLSSVCSSSDQDAAVTFAQSLCKSAGVDVPGAVSDLCPLSSSSVAGASASAAAAAGASDAKTTLTGTQTSTTEVATTTNSAETTTASTSAEASSTANAAAGFAVGGLGLAGGVAVLVVMV